MREGNEMRVVVTFLTVQKRLHVTLMEDISST